MARYDFCLVDNCKQHQLSRSQQTSQPAVIGSTHTHTSQTIRYAPVDIHITLHRQVSIHQHVTEHVPCPSRPHSTQQPLQPSLQRSVWQHGPAAAAAAVCSCVVSCVRAQECMVLSACANSCGHYVCNSCTDSVVPPCAAGEANGV
jgi:hypothetical protein